MVDTVNIDNIGGEQGVASEVTLKQLLITMELLANKTGANSQDAIRRATEQYRRSLHSLDEAVRESREETEENTRSVRRSTVANKAFVVSIGLITNTIGVLTGSAVGLANEFLRGGNQIKDFTQHLPLGLNNILGHFAGFVDNTVTVFRELSSVGAAFGNDLTILRTSAVASGLSLDEFSGIVSSNAETLRVLGGTVSQGTAEFINLTKKMKDSGDQTSLRNLGFTLEEVNEGLLSYVELQTRLGRTELNKDKQLTASATEYMHQMDLLAKITGKSRKEAEQALQSQAVDAGFRALEDQLKGNEVALGNFRVSMGLIENLPADVATGLKDLADGAAQTEAAQKLIAAAGPEIVSAMQAVGKGADPTVLTNALAKAGRNIEGFAGASGAEKAALIEGIRQSDPVLASILDAATEMVRVGNIDIAEAKKQQLARADSTSSILKFEDSVRKVREILQTGFIQGGVLTAVTDGMGVLADLVNSDKFKQAVKEFTAFIVNQVKEFAKWAGTLTAENAMDKIIDGVVGLFSNSKLADAIASGVSTLFDKVVSKLFGGSSEQSTANSWASDTPGPKASGSGPASTGNGFTAALDSVGSMFTSVGIGLGAVVAALAAAGFMAKPLLAGGTAIGGAIAAIGLGLTGAAWITDSTIPKLMITMDKFMEIDAAQLSALGGALVDFSAGLAAFAGGSVLGGVGAIATRFSEGFAFLTRADSPLEKLKAFGEVDLKTDIIIANANAINVFGKAFQTLARSEMAEASFDLGVLKGIEQLSELDGDALIKTSKGIKGIAEVKGFESKITALKGLNARDVDSYRKSLDKLVDTLEEMNKQLEGNSGGGGKQAGTSAGDVVSQLAPKDNSNQVNSSALLSVLHEIRDINKRTLRAINDQSGTVY